MADSKAILRMRHAVKSLTPPGFYDLAPEIDLPHSSLLLPMSQYPFPIPVSRLETRHVKRSASFQRDGAGGAKENIRQ